MGRALGPSREQNSNSRPLLKVKSNSQRAADKKKGGGKSASAQPIFRIPVRIHEGGSSGTSTAIVGIGSRYFQLL
jgi:hypothetical protein